MGRPPCCDKTGVKKGPWTPEEDVILVSYIQENGPGNWRSVPSNTGLMRCSKSCRLRWTNYLKPGIKRGNFTEQEEKLIFHLQALLGNRWAAIASYLPERTDNDIKNYWNTHLNKKLRKIQNGSDGTRLPSSHQTSMAKGQWERRLQTDIGMAKKALNDALSFGKLSSSGDDSQLMEMKPVFDSNDLMRPIYSSSRSSSSSSSSSSCSSSFPSTYASSTENISRLLKNWMRKPPQPPLKCDIDCSSSGLTQQSFRNTSKSPPNQNLESRFESLTTPEGSDTSGVFQGGGGGEELVHEMSQFSMLETWLFDEVLVDVQLDDTSDFF